MSIVSLDLETTGLDERIHEAWEVAIIPEDGVEICYQFPLRKRFHEASPEALEISGWEERYAVNAALGALETEPYVQNLPPVAAVRHLASRTKGATLMGCAISFDMRFLTDLMRAYGVEPAWHHRGLDLGSYAAGVLRVDRPMASADMAACIPNPEAHTALGDARWNWEVYRWLRSQ